LQPQEIYSPRFVFQKIGYNHNSPVVAGIVEKPQHYLYSSARDYFKKKKCGLLDVTFLWLDCLFEAGFYVFIFFIGLEYLPASREAPENRGIGRQENVVT